MDEETRAPLPGAVLHHQGRARHRPGPGDGLRHACSGTAPRSRSTARRARARPCGSAFRRRRRCAAGVAAESAPQRRRRRLRILVVDDDPLLLKSLRDTLDADGHIGDHRGRRPGGIDAFRRRVDSDEAVRRGDHRPGHALRRRPQGRRRRQGSIAVHAGDHAHRLGPAAGRRGDVPPHVDRVLSKPPKLRELARRWSSACRRPGPERRHR